MEPIMLQPTMSTQSQERPGLFGRVRDFFTTDDPNAGQATDPFAGLSRSQRTMLGFAALRDAAAALEGRDSNFFQSALGGFESARERERLRAQGQMQNQVGALQALAQIEQQIAFSQSLGVSPSPALMQLRDALTAQAMGAGMPSPTVIRDGGTVPTPAGGGMAAPGDFMGGTLPTGGLSTATGAIPGDQYLAEMQRTGESGVDAQGNLMPEGTPAPAVSPMDDLDAREAAIYEQMRARMGSQAPTRDLELQLQAIQEERAALAQEQQFPTEAVARARGEFMGLPAVRSFADQTSAFGRVVASAEDPSPAGDLALIFNYMKVLDPGSVVREGEFATVQNSGGVDQRVRSLYNSLLEGERLTAEQRADFLDRASRLYGQAEEQYTSLANQYRGFAEAAGLPVEQVIPDLGFAGTIPERRTPPPPAPEGVDPAVWQNMTDDERRQFLEAAR